MTSKKNLLTQTYFIFEKQENRKKSLLNLNLFSFPLLFVILLYNNFNAENEAIPTHHKIKMMTHFQNIKQRKEIIHI